MHTVWFSSAAVSLALQSVPLMLAFHNAGMMVNISGSRHAVQCSAGRRTADCRLTGAGSVWRAALPGGHLAVQLKCPVTDQLRCNAIYLAGARLSGYRQRAAGASDQSGGVAAVVAVIFQSRDVNYSLPVMFGRCFLLLTSCCQVTLDLATCILSQTCHNSIPLLDIACCSKSSAKIKGMKKNSICACYDVMLL